MLHKNKYMFFYSFSLAFLSVTYIKLFLIRNLQHKYPCYIMNNHECNTLDKYLKFFKDISNYINTIIIKLKLLKHDIK